MFAYTKHSKIINLFVYSSDLLHSTNDGCNEKRLFVTDLSARLSSVLSLHHCPQLLPVVGSEGFSSIRHVHSGELSGRNSTFVGANGSVDEAHAAGVPTAVVKARQVDVDLAVAVSTDEQLLVADAIGTNEARSSVLVHCEQAVPLPFEVVFSPT